MDMIGKVHRCTCTETIEEFDKPRKIKKQQPNFGFHDTSKKCAGCVAALLGGKNELVSPFPSKNNL